jgi:hypothetical protein
LNDLPPASELKGRNFDGKSPVAAFALGQIMPHGTVVEIIPAPRAEVFRLLHDYTRRLEWDTLLQAAYLTDGDTQAGLHAVSVCKGRAHLGGIEVKAVYVSFRPPDVAAVKMVNCPWLFDSLAATIRHRDLADGASRVEYSYNFSARPRCLRWLLHPVMHNILRYETQRRLRSLRIFFAAQLVALRPRTPTSVEAEVDAEGQMIYGVDGERRFGPYELDEEVRFRFPQMSRATTDFSLRGASRDVMAECSRSRKGWIETDHSVDDSPCVMYVAAPNRQARANVLAVAAFLCLAVVAIAADQKAGDTLRNTLTPDELKLLDGLFQRGLFDPTGAERVRVRSSARTPYGEVNNPIREAWFCKGTPARPGRLVFIDGEEQTVSDRRTLTTVDFLDACRARFPASAPKAQPRETIRRVSETKRAEQIDRSPLAIAAWLHRLGHDDLAARALRVARTEASINGQGHLIADDHLVDAFSSDVAWISFSEMVDAFMLSADAEALVAGQRLFRLHAAAASRFNQAPVIMADLERRKKPGKFGHTRRFARPADFNRWDVARQVAYLIDQLDQVTVRQMSPWEPLVFSADPCVHALVSIGDPAVPALIAVVENDARLTRSVQYSNDWNRGSTVRSALSVREPALEALMTITGTQFFEEELQTGLGEARARQLANQLKEYWNRYGKLAFDVRMMRILTDPAADFVLKRQAAHNLAHLGERRFLTRTGQLIESESRAPRKGVKPAVQKFTNPTVARAILAAMDDDLKHFDSLPRGPSSAESRRSVEDGYLQAVVDLGDRTIASELTRRSIAAWQIRQRRIFAGAAHELGARGALSGFAKQIERGGFELPAAKPDIDAESQPAAIELRGIIEDLARMNTPETDRALDAIAEPSHPYFELARSRLLEEERRSWGTAGWYSHRYCLRILRRALDDTEPTGVTYRIAGQQMIVAQHDVLEGREIPPGLETPNSRKGKAVERWCDRAAIRLANLVFGLPDYHPLRKDADARLQDLKRAFDSVRNGYRLATPIETPFLNRFSEALYVPDLPPLNRPATEADVKAGRAIFHLGGKGKLARLQPPAVATSKIARSAARLGPTSKPFLILQAEIDADGKTVYGVVGDGVARKATADELTDIEPMRKSVFDFLK